MGTSAFPVYCRVCRHQIPADAQFCPDCGAPQAPPAPVPSPTLWQRACAIWSIHPGIARLLGLTAIGLVLRWLTSLRTPDRLWRQMFIYFFRIWPVATFWAAEIWCLDLLFRSQYWAALRRSRRVAFTLAICGIPAGMYAVAMYVGTYPRQLLSTVAVSAGVPLLGYAVFVSIRQIIRDFRHDIANSPEGLPFSAVGLLVPFLSLLIAAPPYAETDYAQPLIALFGVVALLCAAVGASKKSRVGWRTIVTAAALTGCGLVISVVGYVALWLHIRNAIELMAG